MRIAARCIDEVLFRPSRRGFTLPRVYAKVIESRGRRPLAMLLAPLSPDTCQVNVLHAAGWRRFGEEILKIDGAVLVSPDGDQLEIRNGKTRLLYADAEPQGPPSWWDTIVLNDHHVCVAFLPPGTPIGTSESLNAFRGHPRTAQALLPLRQLQR